MIPEMTCRDFVDFLDDYLFESVPDDRRAEFNGHLAQCPSCVAYLETYRTSIELGRAVLKRTDAPLPEGVPEALVRAILAARKRTDPT
jgi:anti-sigma factor RsiW